MKAIALRIGADHVELIDIPEPALEEGQVMIKAVRSGICGTDREMVQRKALDVPPGEDFLVLGHEGFGQIVDTRGDTGEFRKGDYVVPLVRRGCGRCNACNNGHADYCYTGLHTERGIHFQHGFFSEYYSDRPQYLAKAEPEAADVAVLTEPLGVSVKASETTLHALERVKFDGWYSQQGKIEKVLVGGHGPIGMLGMMLFHSMGFDVYVAGRRPEDDFQRDLIESIGVRYLRTDTGEVDQFVEEHGGFFMILEATGLSELTFDLARYLGRNGALMLTGVPRHSKRIEIDGNDWMARLVRTNQIIVGSVNQCPGCFDRALVALGRFKELYPKVMSRIITSRFRPEEHEQAFAGKGKDEIKVVIEF